MLKSNLANKVLLCTLLFLLGAPVTAQPFVTNVIHSGNQTLRPGDTLHVIATGSPGGQATVEIMGTPGTENLTETSSGRYETDIVIPKGLTVSNKLLMVTIVQAGQQALGQSRQGITISPTSSGVGIGGRPASTPPPSSIGSQGATRLTPSSGQTLSSLQKIQLDFPMAVDPNSVHMTVNGRDVSRQAVNDSMNAGRQQIVWKNRMANLNGAVRVSVSAKGLNGQNLAESWNFNVRSRATTPPPTNSRAQAATSTFPKNGVTRSSASKVKATFPVALDPNSIIMTVNGKDVSRLAVQSSLNAARNVVQYKPRSKFSGFTQVDLQATGLKGEALSQRWHFTIKPKATGSTPPRMPSTPNHRLGISNLSGGMLLGDKFQIEGTGKPGSTVFATVEFPKQDFLSQLAGVMLKFQGSAKVDGNGHYSIPLNAGGVRRGQPMNITITDNQRSSPVKMAVEKGRGNLQQTNNRKKPPVVNKPKSTQFFDSGDRYGFVVPPGWTRDNSDPDFDIAFSKGKDSTFGVMIRPSNGKNSVDGMNELIPLMKKAGISVNSQHTVQISGRSSQAIVISDSSGGEGILTCTAANGKFYHALVNSKVLSTQPLVKRDMDAMLESFFIK